MSIIDNHDGRVLSGILRPRADGAAAGDVPLIVAIHGGTYTSRYFDVPGASLIERSAALGIPIIAVDRPGYLESTPLPPAEAGHVQNAELLTAAIGRLWKAHGAGTAGVVLIGHSIGGAIALRIAAGRPAWPLRGVAVSGVGLKTFAGDAASWQGLPPIPFIDLPIPLKHMKMFGPPGTYDPAMPAASGVADAPCPRQELIEIVTTWEVEVRDVAAKINVPVHYRQAEFDNLWTVDQGEVTGFAQAFTAAPSVDAALAHSAGHCIDFHLVGAAFQLEQLAFATRCAALTHVA